MGDNIIGIYQILNKVNGKCYIGLSTNIRDRFYRHKSKLRNNKHSNIHLQSAYNEYGSSNFEFNILERCSESILSEREIYYINKYQSDNRKYGYNKASGGFMFKHDEESKRKSAENRSYGTGKNSDNPKTFKFISPEGKEFIVVGGFEAFCIKMKISYRMLRRSINKGVIPPYLKSNPTQERVNSNGWSVQQWIKDNIK